MRKSPLRIVVDENVPGAEATFARHGTIHRVDGRRLAQAELRQADALIVRSVTPVDAALLEGTAVRFVGSATIGTDHLDIAWLDRTGIRWAAAPGCNADAAAQYTLAMMLLAGRRRGFDLRERRVGIIGRGNVGSRVDALLRALGADPPVLCDPPLAARGQTGLSGMAEIGRCDVVTLHVPLTIRGQWPTRHMVDHGFLDGLPTGALLVNTARGAVIEPGALAWWSSERRGLAALDVWPNEPDVPGAWISAATVATPHVAGYSIDGKLRGTLAVYRAFCEWLGRACEPSDLPVLLPDRQLPSGAAGSVVSAVLAACPVERDDAALRALQAGEAASLATGFDALRRDYPERRDFAGWRLPEDVEPGVRNVLEGLGFH